ncbi:uncharacterized protein [Nicotiana tomentosiformis]|uniref:uncharacterized protein n=1 Tax=Nicotiana tomentosiformis TaxID=4098 RepID=UPI00388C4541
MVEIDGLQMWLQKWTPDFRPDEDISIVLVWILLPGLPFNMHTWQYVKQICSEVGTPLSLDVAINGKTRPRMAKVRVEIDLLKPLVDSVFIGSEDENAPLKASLKKLSMMASLNTEGFLNTVKKVRDTDINGNSMWRLQSKQKLFSKRLSQWSKEEIGNIHAHVLEWEEKIYNLEEIDITNNNEDDMEATNKAHIEYIIWLNTQDSLLSQKANIQ